MASKKKEKIKNGESDKIQYNINPDVLTTARKKLAKGESINANEFNQLLTKAAKDFRERTTDAGKTALEYISALVGVNESSLNSYYFMSFQIMNTDMTTKVHPYVAFTNALVHALNLGYHLGRLDFDGSDTASTRKAKPAPRKRKAKPKKTRGKK